MKATNNPKILKINSLPSSNDEDRGGGGASTAMGRQRMTGAGAN